MTRPPAGRAGMKAARIDADFLICDYLRLKICVISVLIFAQLE
jgi:hypothetical protein